MQSLSAKIECETIHAIALSDCLVFSSLAHGMSLPNVRLNKVRQLAIRDKQTLIKGGPLCCFCLCSSALWEWTRKAWIFKALCCGWEPAEHNSAGVLPLCHFLQKEASKAIDRSAPFRQKYICYGWNRLLGLMCKCCPLLKYPESWFENCMVSWFLSNSLISSRALALWFLSVLSLSCIWVPACCRFGSSLCWAESTELLAVARETQQPTEQSYCSRAQDLVSLHPIPWCCIKTPQSLCFIQNWDFTFG